MTTQVRDERWAELRRLDEWLRTPMLILSALWLGIVLAELVGTRSVLLETFGTAIYVAFVAEFLIRLTIAPDKSEFLRRNWLTVISLAVPALRLFRALRVLRAARALRALGSSASSAPPTAP